MRVLSIGSDRAVLNPGSDAAKRVTEFWGKAGEVHIIVITAPGFNPASLGPKMWVHPTNSTVRLLSWLDVWRLARRLDSFDLVSAQDPFEAGFAAWLVCRGAKAKLQLQVHTDLFSPYFSRGPLLNKVMVLVARFLLPRADSIRVVSQRIKDSLDSRFLFRDSRVVVLPIFVDVEKLRQASIKTDLHKKYPQFEKIILMASRLTREKNIGLAVAAMRSVVLKFPHVGLVIVGSGPEEQKLKLIPKTYNLEPNVVFEPWTNDLASYYKTADLFLNTSWYEGYGRTIVEALACGLPVVSTDVGIARERDATIVGFTPGELADSLLNILQ